MPRIGEFEKTENGFRGSITTPEKSSNYIFEKNAEKETEQHPDYIIKAPNGAEVGAAWDAKSQGTGKDYVSYDIDDPTRAQPLRGNLSANEQSGKWDVYFSRDSGRSQDNSQRAQPSAQNSGNAAPPDNMPDFTVPQNGQDQGQSL